jgi:hypothetical protein
MKRMIELDFSELPDRMLIEVEDALCPKTDAAKQFIACPLRL